MKKTIIAFAMATAALAMLAAGANATTSTYRHSHYAHKAHKTHVAKHYKHGAYLRKGYSRKGPRYGYGFGFSTYAGDPFYSDDYFDGRRCYYLHRRDFCRGPKSLDWLRWR